MKKLGLCAIVAVSAAACSVTPGAVQPVRAVYEAVLPENPAGSLVRSVEITLCPDRTNPQALWHRLVCEKHDGSRFRIWLLATGNVLRWPVPEGVEFLRYILEEPGKGPVEYVHQRTGRALTPLFDFVGQLLPRAEGPCEGPLFEKGVFLGHPIVRKQVSAEARVRPPRDIRRLLLDPDLLIGTSRNFKDDGTGRPDPNANYGFTPFVEADYEKMIAAGINYFLVDEKQYEWIDGQAVFYENYAKKPRYYPEELFRSTFRGANMFIDEPACILAGQHARDASPVQAARNLQAHIREKNNGQVYRSRLREAGIDVGTMDLTEPAIPIWETYVSTAYYQLEANRYGIVQECRWQPVQGNRSRGTMLRRLNEMFDVDIPLTPRNQFLWFYSQMIGPARVLQCKWGMSLYGQAEPELRVPSMELAYDLGASFIWFWTSDHDHHVLFTEQLELARAITDYAKTHPRPDPATLLNQAKVAIVLPYGYAMPSCFEMFMYGSYIFKMERKNEFGLSYKEVLAPAVKEAARCLRDDVAYDVLPAAEGLDLGGYEEVIRIGEDGSVQHSRRDSAGRVRP